MAFLWSRAKARKEIAPSEALGPSSPPPSFGSLATPVQELSTTSLSLASSFQAGEDVYFLGDGYWFPSGDFVVYGGKGIVVAANDQGCIDVKFPENKWSVPCEVHQLSKTAPALPGSFQAGEVVFFLGDAYSFRSGDFVEHGGRGIVMGAGTGEKIQVKFPENKWSVPCSVEELSRTPPTLPGGLQVGEEVFFLGNAQLFPSGSILLYGGKGIVVGAGTGEHKGRIDVKFPENKSNILCSVEELSKTPPTLPGGFQAGEDVFFLGDACDFRSGDFLVHGGKGIVMGADAWEKIHVKFPENKWSVSCPVEELSKTSPALPGGFQAGEDVYFVSVGKTLPDGGSLTYGSRGIVMGTGTRGNRGCIKVKFPQNKWDYPCNVEQLSKTPPGPLPDGLQVGGDVYFVGGGKTLPNHDFVVYGGKGVVTGENEGSIKVKFRQNKWDVPCKVEELCKMPPGPLPHVQVGEAVYFVGRGLVLANGDAAIYSGKGIVMGAGTGENTGRIEVKFPHNEGNVPCPVEELSRTAPGPLLGGYQATEQTHLALQKLQAERDLALGRLEASCLLQMPRTSELRGVLPNVPLSSPLGKFLCSLISSTSVRHRVELESSEFGSAPRLRVLGIEDVRRAILFDKYMTGVLELRERHHERGCVPFDMFPHLRVDDASLPPGQVNVNECFVIHGAPSEVVLKICKDGFDPQRAHRGRFGRGSYFGVNASKCDLYTDHAGRGLPRRSRGSERKLIVARAALGQVFRLAHEDRSEASRPPDGYDSVWGDTYENGGCVDYPELVIFKEQQALPLFVITYVHECPVDALCSECRKRPE